MRHSPVQIKSSIQFPAVTGNWADIIQGIPENAALVAKLIQGMANVNAAATEQTIQYVQEVISEAIGHYNSAVIDLLARIDFLT